MLWLPYVAAVTVFAAVVADVIVVASMLLLLLMLLLLQFITIATLVVHSNTYLTVVAAVGPAAVFTGAFVGGGVVAVAVVAVASMFAVALAGGGNACSQC